MKTAPPDLVIDSVTGVDVVLAIAGPGARSYAFLIDWCIRAVLCTAWYVMAALTYNGRLSLSPPLSQDARWFVFVVAPPAAIYFLYHVALEIAMHGRSPGKRIAAVRIVSRDGSAPSVGALLIRNVFRLVDSLPLFYGVGLIASLLTRDQVRVGDMAAGTLLVYDHAADVPPQPAKNAAASASKKALTITLLQRSNLWRTAVARANRLEHGRAEDVTDAAGVADDYRLLAHDLARVRRLMPDSRAHQYLEAAYARTHATLQRGAWHPGYALLTLFRDDIPAVVSWLRPHIIWATLIFILTVFAGYWLVHTYPALISLFASPDLVATVERGQLWTDGILNVVPSSVLSLQILTNNIVVSLFAYCAGFLFGLGTLYILGLNGLMLGAVFAFTRFHGLDDDLFRFIVAHGCVELSVMCLSGAAGAAVGEALIRPTHASRLESFRIAALRSGKLLIACVVLLIGSGIIEGYVSPSPRFSLSTRVVIGVGYWLFMLALLRGWLFGWTKRAATAAAFRTPPTPPFRAAPPAP